MNPPHLMLNLYICIMSKNTAWPEYENLIPEERLHNIVEILAKGVLRLIEKKKGTKQQTRPTKPSKKWLKCKYKIVLKQT